MSQAPFTPFGSVVLSTQTGKLLHADPILLSSGDLYFKIFYQNASLFNLPLKDIPNPTSATFYLAPIGIRAKYIESTPIPKDSLSFFDLVRFATGVSYSSPSQELGNEWGLFQIDAFPTPLPWPLKFAYTQPVENSPGNIDFSWFTTKDIMSDLESQINTMKSIIGSGYQGQETTNISITKPANGKPPENAFVFNTGGDVKKQAGSSNVYPTPPDPSTKQRNEGDTIESTNWATPAGFGNDTWGDLDEELFGDEKEITEADFNFFDDQKVKHEPPIQPTIPEEPDELIMKNQLPLHPSMMNAQNPSDQSSYASTSESNLYSTIPTDWDDSTSDKAFHFGDPATGRRFSFKRGLFSFQIQDKFESNEEESFDSLMKKRRTSVFSPLRFNPVILEGIDPKYSRGGRFFVSDESDEDEDEVHDGKHVGIEVVENEQGNKSNFDGTVNGIPTPDPLTHVMGTLQNASTPDWLESSKQKLEPGNESGGTTSEWVQIFTIPMTSAKDKFSIRLKDIDAKFDESPDFEAILNIFVEQIVWDDELLEDIIPSVVYPEQPDQDVLNIVAKVFPSLQKLTLYDAIYISEAQPAQPAPPLQNDSITPNISKTLSGTESVPENDSTLSRTETETTSQPTTESAVTRKSEDDLVYPITPPHFSFIRMEQVLKAKTPILRFWKVFGLNPRYGQKNITTLLIHPAGEGLESVCQTFLGMFKSSYESCGLGDVDFASFNNFKNGVVPIPYKSNSFDQMMESVKETLANIGRDISIGFKDQNLVILFANPFQSVSSLIRLSHAFVLMSRAFMETNISSKLTPRIAFQIVPLSFFAARDAIFVPSQYKMVRFALNVYDKCLNQGESIISPLKPLPFRLTCQRRCPAFTLARMPPQRINFKLTDTPSSALLEEDSFIHIAYALSEDSKWLTAAWTDQWGEISKVEAFCLLKTGAQPRTFEEVCGEIWQKTLAILTHVPVQWRVALAKIGPMEEEELEMWKRFASSSSKSISSAYFLSVDLNPSFIVTGDINLFPHGQFQRASTAKTRITRDFSSTTPITPQRGGDFESPDTYMLNATPPSAQAESEKIDMEDVTIVDVKNDIYGIIFKNCVSPMTTHMSPTFKPLVMGYLLKPGNSGEEQRLFEVTFVHCPTPPTPSMKNILSQYRGLASLSSFTGVRNGIDSIAPWHIEAVEKVQRVLIQVS